MANELTDKAKVNIEKILSQNAFHKAQSQEAPATPPTQAVCHMCKCPGGNGMIQMGLLFVPCPVCVTIV
jgi:hypothetical protein